MPIRALAFASAFGLVASLGACTEPPKPTKEEAKKEAKDAPADAKGEPKGDEPAKAPVEAEPGKDDGSSAAGDDPLGSRFKDPSWYREDIIPHTAVIQNGRSEARENGTFSSAMVLELEEGMTPEKCTDHLKGRVEDIAFEETETGQDGRLTTRGETDRFRVTLVCGNAKGKPTAYVGYEWKAEGE